MDTLPFLKLTPIKLWRCGYLLQRVLKKMRLTETTKIFINVGYFLVERSFLYIHIYSDLILISYVIRVGCCDFVGRRATACDFSFFSKFEFSPKSYSIKSAKIHIHMWMRLQTAEAKIEISSEVCVCLWTLIKFSKRRQLWLNRNIIMTLTISSCQ